jgi:hypothetical protein
MEEKERKKGVLFQVAEKRVENGLGFNVEINYVSHLN